MEEWKNIPGYEGLYQVSNLGRVKSIGRYIKFRDSKRFLKERIMKPNIGIYGYAYFYLHKEDSSRKTLAAHQLVAMAFLGHNLKNRKMVIDHINHDTSNNTLENLQILSNRANASKRSSVLSKDYTSKYVGVSRKKGRKEFTSAIRINGNVVHLGLFEKDSDAGELYQIALKNIDKFNGDKNEFRTLIKGIQKELKKDKK